MRLAAFAAGILVLASPQLSAQSDFALPVDGVPTRIDYDLKTNTWTYAGGDADQKSGPVVIVDNAAFNGYFAYYDAAGTYGLDNGSLAAGGHNCVTKFEIGYATNSATPIDLRIRFFSNSVSCAGSPGALEASFLLTGLPASNGTTILPFAVGVDLTGVQCFELPDGDIGWAYERFNTGTTGPLLAGPPNAPGVLNQYGKYTTADALVGCYSFGGTPMASFYMKLTGHRSSSSFGAGCPGEGGFVPALSMTGCACEGAYTTLQIANGQGGAQAALIIAGGPGSYPLANCTIDVELLGATIMVLGPLDHSGAGAGTKSLGGIIPSGLAGVSGYIQGVIKDSTAGTITTNGLQLDVAP